MILSCHPRLGGGGPALEWRRSARHSD